MTTPSALDDLDLQLAAGESTNGRNANPYTYQALDEVTPQIRLIRLQPGSPGSPIVVSLSTVDFRPGGRRKLQYEALSYTWGNTNDTTQIEINTGGEDKQNELLNVPTNCYEALHALRYVERSRTLWIDAICINQKDDNEKGHQVTIMADVYRKAFKVTAWVGQASEFSERAFEYMREVSSHVSVDPDTHELVLLSEDNRWIKYGGDALIMEHQTDALAELLSRPWFSRVWIWQEIRLGYSRAVIKCGDLEIPWSSLRAVVKYLKGKMVCGRSAVKLSVGLQNVLALCDMRNWSFLDLLNIMRASKCLDRRDRVFAVRGMVRREEQGIIGRPNYTKTWHTVYSGLCVDYARRDSSLTFLEFVTDHKERGLPSCTPSWMSGQSSIIDRGNGRTSGFSRCALVGFDGRHLTVKGRLVTKVRAIVPYAIAGSPVEHSHAKHWKAMTELLRSIRIHMTPNDGHENLPGLVDVLAFGRFAETYNQPPEDMKKLEDSTNAIEVVSTWPEDEPLLAEAVQKVSANCLEAVYKMSENCLGMSFAFGTDGKTGLIPWSARPGDIISVVLGCNLPMVLRPTLDACYEVIGPAYVAGMMQGQSLFGPLPPHYYFLWWRRKGFVQSAAFQNEMNSITELTDPRLPQLPPEWRYFGSIDHPVRIAFENIQTGETRRHWEDPRCDADALEARGVKLDTITFV